jgi:hypothetical protein
MNLEQILKKIRTIAYNNNSLVIKSKKVKEYWIDEGDRYCFEVTGDQFNIAKECRELNISAIGGWWGKSKHLAKVILVYK